MDTSDKVLESELIAEVEVRARPKSKDELTSPRFWEMRRLLVEFRQLTSLVSIEEGDLVGLMNDRKPWICSRVDEDLLTLSNMDGQTTKVIKPLAALYLNVISKAET